VVTFVDLEVLGEVVVFSVRRAICTSVTGMLRVLNFSMMPLLFLGQRQGLAPEVGELPAPPRVQVSRGGACCEMSAAKTCNGT